MSYMLYAHMNALHKIVYVNALTLNNNSENYLTTPAAIVSVFVCKT